MQAIGRQPHPPIRAPDGAPVHYERHRPEQTTLYRLVQQHAATFFEQAGSAAGADLPQFVRDEFDAFLECGILAHGFLRLSAFMFARTTFLERDTSAFKNLHFVSAMSKTLPPRLISRSPSRIDRLPLASNTRSKTPSSAAGSGFV